MSGDDRIRSVLVAGGGIVGYSAALAFARALPDAQVQVLDLPPDPAALADRMPGMLPPWRDFHRLIGVDEKVLLREAAATHRTGMRFEDWSADGESWLHCFGHHGSQMGVSPFHHQWARLRRAGQALPYHCYAPVAVLAAEGKFVHPSNDVRSLLASYDYALRVEPEPYRALLASRALAHGVRSRAARLRHVEVSADGGVAALLVDEGDRLEADLFIDCAGPSAPLLSAVAGDFEDWGDDLPCVTLLLGELTGQRPWPLDVATAVEGGWLWRYPLRTRAMVGAAHAAAYGSGDAITAALRMRFGDIDLEQVTIRPGRRPDAWVRNVVAFGDAAVAVDPLESTNLHLAQSAIARAVTLIPPRSPSPLLLQAYNSRTQLETDRIRDFLALHYLASNLDRGPFWRSMAERPRPAGLSHTLAQFAGRGRFPSYEEETFRRESWLAVLFGLGVQPARIDPTAYRIPFEESVGRLRMMGEQCRALPRSLPSYGDYLQALASSEA